jgi:2-(1,2-epoxy-1,2-dihydrophenyl)acetyl-CoA isomerase
LLRNQTWDAETAVKHGLASELVGSDELQDKAFALAKELADGPDYALGEIKRLLLDSYSQPLEQQLEMESRALTRCTKTDQTWEALNAVAKGKKVIFNKKQES